MEVAVAVVSKEETQDHGTYVQHQAALFINNVRVLEERTRQQ